LLSNRIPVDKRGYIPYNSGESTERRGLMPTISYFYGIIIVMYLRNKEHNPPHIHAITQDFDAPFLIATGEIMEGEFPPKAKALVKEFILKNQNDLLEMWETEKYKKLPPLD
jgi:hypothetical protein